MIGPVLQFEDLCAVTGYRRLADVEQCLERQGIRYFRGKGGVWTTIGLVEAAGGLRPPAANDAELPYSPDLVG